MNNQHITGNLGNDLISRRIHFPLHHNVLTFHVRILKRLPQIPIQLRFAFYTVFIHQVLLKSGIIPFKVIRSITNTWIEVPTQWSTTTITTRTRRSILTHSPHIQSLRRISNPRAHHIPLVLPIPFPEPKLDILQFIPWVKNNSNKKYQINIFYTSPILIIFFSSLLPYSSKEDPHQHYTTTAIDLQCWSTHGSDKQGLRKSKCRLIKYAKKCHKGLDIFPIKIVRTNMGFFPFPYASKKNKVRNVHPPLPTYQMLSQISKHNLT